MREEKKANNHTREEIIQLPDLIDLWKNIYFQTEATCAHIGKEFVTSDTFVEMLGQIRDQYLSNHKVSSQTLDKYLEINPIATKKDIARIAELIISVEDKQDNLDLQFSDSLNSLTTSLMRLVDFQHQLKNEISQIRHDLSLLATKFDHISRTLQEPPREAQLDTAGKKKSTAKIKHDPLNS